LRYLIETHKTKMAEEEGVEFDIGFSLSEDQPLSPVESISELPGTNDLNLPDFLSGDDLSVPDATELAELTNPVPGATEEDADQEAANLALELAFNTPEYQGLDPDDDAFGLNSSEAPISDSLAIYDEHVESVNETVLSRANVITDLLNVEGSQKLYITLCTSYSALNEDGTLNTDKLDADFKDIKEFGTGTVDGAAVQRIRNVDPGIPLTVKNGILPLKRYYHCLSVGMVQFLYRWTRDKSGDQKERYNALLEFVTSDNCYIFIGKNKWLQGLFPVGEAVLSKMDSTGRPRRGNITVHYIHCAMKNPSIVFPMIKLDIYNFLYKSLKDSLLQLREDTDKLPWIKHSARMDKWKSSYPWLDDYQSDKPGDTDIFHTGPAQNIIKYLYPIYVVMRYVKDKLHDNPMSAYYIHMGNGRVFTIMSYIRYTIRATLYAYERYIKRRRQFTQFWKFLVEEGAITKEGKINEKYNFDMQTLKKDYPDLLKTNQKKPNKIPIIRLFRITTTLYRNITDEQLKLMQEEQEYYTDVINKLREDCMRFFLNWSALVRAISGIRKIQYPYCKTPMEIANAEKEIYTMALNRYNLT